MKYACIYRRPNQIEWLFQSKPEIQNIRQRPAQAYAQSIFQPIPNPRRVTGISPASRKQVGASLTEFAVVAPVILLVGMTTVQAGLIYHGKTTLNYATFEAARAGAVNHAQLKVMRKELGLRLAPLQGGDGSHEAALQAIGKSYQAVQDPLSTQLDILNPTTAAFEDWGIAGQKVEGKVLPNSHLRHRDHTIGGTSGLSLRDANLLKIKVTHGLNLNVPLAGSLIAKSLMLIDPGNAHFYARNKLPITSVATVRMQSEAWHDEIVTASLAPSINDQEGTAEGSAGDDVSTSVINTESATADEIGAQCGGGEHGLGSSPILMETAAYEEGMCTAQTEGMGLPSSAIDECEG